MTVDGKKHISLKEAAELSGYTQDYLGQLIRSGKLPGKKVYVNVAWMTTEEDLREYLAAKAGGNGGGNANGLTGTGVRPHGLLRGRTPRNGGVKKNGGRAEAGRRRSAFQRLTKPALFFFLGLLTAVVLVLFYVFAVNLDSKLDRRAVDDMGAQLLPDTRMDTNGGGTNQHENSETSEEFQEFLMVTPEGGLVQL